MPTQKLVTLVFPLHDWDHDEGYIEYEYEKLKDCLDDGFHIVGKIQNNSNPENAISYTITYILEK